MSFTEKLHAGSSAEILSQRPLPSILDRLILQFPSCTENKPSFLMSLSKCVPDPFQGNRSSETNFLKAITLKKCARMNLKTRRVTINRTKCKLKKRKSTICLSRKLGIHSWEQGRGYENLKIFNEVVIVQKQNMKHNICWLNFKF